MSKTGKAMSNKELRKFGLMTGGLLILFFDLLIPWIWGHAPPLWPVIAAGLLATMALLFPAALGLVYKAWMRFAEALGWVNTRIILTIMFYLIFFPVGMIMRIFGDPMRRKFDASADTYRVPSDAIKHENMEKPF